MSQEITIFECIPQGWQIKTIDDLCDVARGGSPRPIKQFLTDDPNGVNWIKIADATASSKYIYATKQKIKPEGIQRSRLVKDGDFLLSNSMSFGRPYIMRTTGCIHDGWLLLRDKSGEFDQDFLYHFLGSSVAYRQFDLLAAGSTVRNLNIDLVKGVQVMLPPLPEQKRIVAILDKAFEGINQAKANAEKNLANARELFESYLNDVFTRKGEGWEEVLFGDTCDFVRGPFGGSLKKSCFVEDGYAVYEQQHAINDQFSQIRYFVDQEKFDEMKRFEIRSGDLIMSCSGTMGKIAIAPQNVKQGIINQALLKLTPKKNLSSGFLKYWMESNSFQEQIASHSKGVAIKNVASVKVLKKINVPVPQPDVQHNVVIMLNNYLRKTQHLQSIYQQKLNALQELKQSILHKAFSGNLDTSIIH